MDPTSALGQWLALAVLAPSAAKTPAATVYRTYVPSGSACPPPLETGASPAEIATELGIRALWFELHLAVLANGTQGGGSEACLIDSGGAELPRHGPQRAVRHFYIYRLV
jgi:hypothetical protein